MMYMRLSLRRAAHVVVAGSAKEEIRVPPDFLWRPVALMIYMRLSPRRAAHVLVAGSAKEEIRVRECLL
jgi:hypothetical protein